MHISLKNIVKRYGKITAVNNITLKIDGGALHFLLGPSGCGKTTVLRMLAGLEQPSSGQIFFDDLDVTNTSAAARGVGMVFQNYALWPHMTVLENIKYGLKIRKLGKDVIYERATEALAMTQLTAYQDRFPGQLSGGEQQRVALARALAVRPKVLLLDEPLSNLDAKLRHEMRENISRIHEQTGITTVYVTHDQKEALSMGTSVSVMKSGSIIQTATPRDLYRNPQSTFVASFIGEMNVICGVYRGIKGTGHVLDTSFGPFVSQRMFGDITPGQNANLCIRPESMLLVKDAIKSDGNYLKMQLSTLSYLGETEQLVFSFNEQIIRANLFNPGDQALKSGDWATLEIPQNSSLILPIDHAQGKGR
jgi:ABC-type Fe3+/spermidine/putrescine transport system ATPase subunit